MKNYDTIANTVGAFPGVVSQNATGPGATDGTPYIKQVIDDLWGFSQALMNHAGLSPDGVTEADGASQRLLAMQRVCGGPGEVVGYMGNPADLVTNNVRLLYMTGQDIVVADFPDLVAAVQVIAAANPTATAFYRHDGVGGRDVAGTHMRMPNPKGYAMRGLSHSVDSDRPGPPGSYAFLEGSAQGDAFEAHRHEVNTFPAKLTVYMKGLASSGATPRVVTDQSTSPDTIIADEVGITQGNVNDNETRMLNVATNWCIRY